ncbi:prephenate/arogenate dehydrogenase [Phormidium sp. CLA17]|uniref:prephenate/arogenate dehydrogenase n=1 Tax=Leptolyngbya sp. Cla-17 TaxID=2803751 RepID=UPI001492375A|nr:prephenate/arogenate dehydrogenase [Leptolyngbya sp. Cla-17]MBM0742912.1 prephenate/arogenate dehydrogenase [Leptolyngbya sp. Cla-17]
MIIGIVGLGLIGGSLGLDFRSQGHRVLGVSRKPETCERAIARGVADDASVSPNFLRPADVVFVCTPLGVMEAVVDEILSHLSPDAVLTDVGSVKGWVMQAIAPKWANFVGGHPMAGTAESGIEAAQRELFINCAYVLTPMATTPPEAVQRVEDLARSLQAQVYCCSPEEHDRAVAWISHLPVMVSTSLISACHSEADKAVLELARKLASSGFRDTSRVGGGNPELGVMMAKYNQEALLRSLYAYRNQLDQAIDHIEQSNWATLEQALQTNQHQRPNFMH